MSDEIPPAPEIEEVWDGGRGEYVTEVTFGSGSKFTVVKERHGAYAGCFSIHGKDFYRDGFSSPERALAWLTDIEHWGW